MILVIGLVGLVMVVRALLAGEVALQWQPVAFSWIVEIILCFNSMIIAYAAFQTKNCGLSSLYFHSPHARALQVLTGDFKASRPGI